MPSVVHERFFVQILQVVLQVLLGVTSLLLTLLILLHRGRGGGLSDMFGGGVTSNLGSSGVAERNLNRFTVILGLVWVACIVVLGLMTKFDSVGWEYSWLLVVVLFAVPALERARWASRIAVFTPSASRFIPGAATPMS